MKGNRAKKLIVLILALLFLASSLIGLFPYSGNISYGSTMLPPRTCTNIAGIDNARYPGFRDRIQELQRQHPSWNFVLFYTGLNWNEAVNGQLQGHGATPTSLFEFSAGVRDRRLALPYMWSTWI